MNEDGTCVPPVLTAPPYIPASILFNLLPVNVVCALSSPITTWLEDINPSLSALSDFWLSII